MKRTTALVLAAIVAIVAGYWGWQWWATRDVAVDLVDAFRGAEKRSSMSVTTAFNAEPQTIKGITRSSIFIHPTSRLTYKVTIPAGARLRGWLGIKEDAWDRGTDGVLFRIGVSGDGRYTELKTQHVDPSHNPQDRDWLPFDLDLAPWAGKEVSLIFNTNASLPNYEPNELFDFAVIGAPRVVVAAAPAAPSASTQP